MRKSEISSRMPKAQRWKAIPIEELQPSNILVRGGVLKSTIWNFELKPKRVKFNPNLPDVFVVSAEPFPRPYWEREHFKISGITCENEPVSTILKIPTKIMVLIYNENYLEEKRIQEEWKADTLWYEAKKLRKQERAIEKRRLQELNK